MDIIAPNEWVSERADRTVTVQPNRTKNDCEQKRDPDERFDPDDENETMK